VVTIGMAIRAVFNYTTGKKLAQYLEKKQAENVPLSRQELISDCDDENNAANYWKAAEALFLLERGNRKYLGNVIRNFFYDEPLQVETRTKTKQAIEKNRRVLQLIQEASEKPCFRYGNWRRKMYDMEYPQTPKMIRAVELLGIDAVFQAEEGAIEDAILQIRKGMRFVRKTLDEPTLITTLAAVANMKNLLFCLNQITSGREIDSEILLSLKRDLDPLLWRKRFAQGLQGERLFSLESGLGVLNGDSEVLNLDSGGSIFFWLIRPLVKADILWAQTMYDELESAALLPYNKTKEFRIKHARDIESIPWYYYISKIFAPNLSATFLKEAILEANMGAAQISLACKIYMNQHGHLPNNILALVPDILEEAPLDPFTGKPFIYKLQEGGFIVYSIGSNEQDEGGRGTFHITQLIMEKDDDWAWKEIIK
jgi:hypothetical protein